MKGIRIRLLSLLLAAVLLTGTGLPALAAADAEGGAEAVVTQESVDTVDTEEEEKDEEPSETEEPEEPTEDADETEEGAVEEAVEEASKEPTEEPAEELAEEAPEEDAEAAREDAEAAPEEVTPEDESAAEITRIEEELRAAEFLREGEEKALRMRLKELRASLAAAGGPQRMLLKAPARGSEKKLINTGGVSVVPSGAAADGNYSFVLKPTRQSTVTFWSDGGFQWETSRRKNDAWKYGVLPKNGSGHAGAWVTDMGSYNGKNIDVKITYFYPDGYYVYTALHADSDAGVLDHYWSGIEYTARYELYLSDDHTKKVYINTGLKFLDLDFCQVFQFRNVDGVLENVSVRNDSYVYGFEENGIWTLISSGEGDDEDHQNLESQSVRFELSGVSTFDFTVSEHGFLNGYTNAIDETGAWTQSGLKEYYNNKSNLYASHLTDDWLEADGGSHAAFNGTGYGPWSIATPEKTVSDADEDEVTENTLSKQGEQLVYRIHQDIPNETSDAHRYASFRFTDTLPEGLTFLSQRVMCGKENVSSHFNLSADGRKLAASAKSPADWPFYGSILTWEITARADAGIEYVNAAEVSVTKKNGNADTKKSNEVRTGYGKKTVKTSAVHGSIDPSATVSTGDNLTVNYQPDKGYHLVSVTVDGKAADIKKYPSSYSFTNITQDHEIHVVYEINTYKVVTFAEGGTIDATREGIEHGSKHTVNYQPDKGYHLASVTVDGKAADIKKYPSSYTFTDISQDHEIRAVFEPNTYRVSTQVVHGSIDPAKEGITHGADHKVNYKPDAGYHLVSVTVDGKAVDIKKYPSAYAFTNITQDHEIRVVYEINTYRITTGVLNGSIDPGKEAVPHGSTEKVAYRPDEGFFISEILVNGEQADPKKIPESYTFANITADQSIRVICTPLPKKEVLNAKGESLDGKTAGRGEAVTYRITVYNAGTLARSVTVTDTVPDEMEFVSAEGGTLKDRTVTWTDVSVPAGGFRALTFTAKSLVSGRAYENAAQVSYGSGTYTTNTVRHYVLPDPVKTVAQGGRDAAGATLFREAGQENNILTYAITWKNISAEEREFTVTDPLPRGAVFVSA
ncbi:MAG: DUF11 domain-containing protein, partial [Lachnospiraceae bacterium]|nr:DUF11 domain-containing protein [Lachnospiraceae bacterium]